MAGNTNGAKKAVQTQLIKYGSKEALSLEMSRRAKMRKTVGGGFRDNPELAKRAREKRRQNEERVKRPRRTDIREAWHTTEEATSPEAESPAQS